jgi:hypothetical protein
MWPFQNSDEAFRSTVRREFALLAVDCGATLQEIETMIFGFCTPNAVLTIGAYPGHFRSICVKLRRREEGERLSVKDGADFGLAVIEEFVAGRRSDIYSKRQRWESAEIKEEVEALALKTREVAMKFLTTAEGDWLGLHAFVDEKIRKARDERPWLKKYEKPA